MGSRGPSARTTTSDREAVLSRVPRSRLRCQERDLETLSSRYGKYCWILYPTGFSFVNILWGVEEYLFHGVRRAIAFKDSLNISSPYRAVNAGNGWARTVAAADRHLDLATPSLGQRFSMGHSLHLGDRGVQIRLPKVTSREL
jgi:hypothetical protein